MGGCLAGVYRLFVDCRTGFCKAWIEFDQKYSETLEVTGLLFLEVAASIDFILYLASLNRQISISSRIDALRCYCPWWTMPGLTV